MSYTLQLSLARPIHYPSLHFKDATPTTTTTTNYRRCTRCRHGGSTTTSPCTSTTLHATANNSTDAHTNRRKTSIPGMGGGGRATTMLYPETHPSPHLLTPSSAVSLPAAQPWAAVATARAAQDVAQQVHMRRYRQLQCPQTPKHSESSTSPAASASKQGRTPRDTHHSHGSSLTI